jgi:hypothetical protein
MSEPVPSTLLLFGDTKRFAALRHEVPVAIVDPLMVVLIDAVVTVLTSEIEPNESHTCCPMRNCSTTSTSAFRSSVRPASRSRASDPGRPLPMPRRDRVLG